MERFKNLVEKINEAMSNGNVDSQFDELVESLSKTKRFKDVYERVKEIDRSLIKCIVPYKFNMIDKKCSLKNIHELADDYSFFIEEINKFYMRGKINEDKFNYLKEKAEEMLNSFTKELAYSEVDRLNPASKDKYYSYKEKISLIYNNYVMDIDELKHIERKYELGNMDERMSLLYADGHKIGDCLQIKNGGIVFVYGAPYNDGIGKKTIFMMNAYDVEKYAYKVMLLEIIYKSMCVKLNMKNEKKEIIKSLIEDLKGLKSDYGESYSRSNNNYFKK